MNAPHPITPPVFSAMMPCPACEGTCTTTEIARVCGEAFDADYIEVPCEECGAFGEVDAICEDCLRVVPCHDGRCAECSEYVPIVFLPVSDLGNGRSQVSA